MADTERTLATVWICCILSVLIMAARLILGRMLCQKRFDRGDVLTCVAIFLAVVRIPVTHVIVLWGTNNISPSLGEEGLRALRATGGVWRKETGSRFTLVARTLYIAFLWIQKSVLLVFYSVLVKDLPWKKKTVRPFWWILAATFVTNIIVTFTGCKPFDHYWKVLPKTDRCAKAIPQLFVVGGTNIFTDILLIILPIPVLWGVRLNWQKKVQLAFLFSVGFVIIAVTAVRLPRTLRDASSETNRITWTTGEFLASTFVANAPTLYSFCQRFRRKMERPDQFARSGPHVGGRSDDLGGTTLTESECGTPRDRLSVDVERAEGMQMVEDSSRREQGKLRIEKITVTDSTTKSND